MLPPRGSWSEAEREQAALDHEGHQQTETAAEQAEQQGLGKDLPHQPEAPGTEGSAQGELAAPRHGAAEDQVGDVDAADGQEPGHREKEEKELRPHFADEALEKGLGAQPDGAGVPRTAGRHLERHAGQPRRGGIGFDAFFEASDHRQVVPGRPPWRAREGAPIAHTMVREHESSGHHADHLGRLLVDRHHATDDARIAAESLLPQPVGEHHGRRGSRAVVVAREHPSGRRQDLQGLEGSGRDEGTAHALGATADVDGPRPEAVAAEATGDVLRFTDRLVHRVRDRAARPAELGHVGLHGHQAVAFGVGKRLEQNAPDEAENGARGTDAEGEGGGCCQGPGRAPGERAAGETEVVCESVHAVSPCRLAGSGSGRPLVSPGAPGTPSQVAAVDEPEANGAQATAEMRLAALGGEKQGHLLAVAAPEGLRVGAQRPAQKPRQRGGRGSGVAQGASRCTIKPRARACRTSASMRSSSARSAVSPAAVRQ